MSFTGMRVMQKLLSAITCCWLLGTTSIRADEPAGPDAVAEEKNEILELESFVVTATRRPMRNLDVAEAITLVGAESIIREAPRVVAELLRGKPGTYFQQTTPGQGVPIIRGLKGSEILHLVDGMRLNNAFFRNAPSQYIALVDSYAVERLEVIRGSAPSLYGADAMGGVMQMLTSDPEFHGNEWDSEGRLYASFNSVETAVVGRASGAAGKAGSAVSGGVTWQEYGDRSVGGGATVSPTAFEALAGDVKWKQALTPAVELMLSAQVLNQPSTPRFDELTPGYGQDHPGSVLYEFKPNRRAFLHARLVVDSDAPWFRRMELHVARQNIIDDRLYQGFGSTVQVNEDNQSTLDGATLQFNTPWGPPGGNQAELVWGMEYYADTVDSSRVDTQIGTGISTPARGRFPDHSTMDSLSLYAANRWQWDRLMFEAGLRYSAFDIHLPASGSGPEADLRPKDLTGDIHLNWELNPQFRILSNIGRGFRPPNIFDLGTLGPRPGNRYNLPNPDLKPESVYSYDLGLKSVGSKFEAEVFVFYTDYQDKITSVLTGETTPDGRLIVRSENVNSARLYGVESGFSWQLTEALETNLVLNYIHGEEKDVTLGTVPADRVPPFNGRLGMIYEPGNGLRVNPRIDFAARQSRLSPRDEADPRIREGGTPGYAAFSVLVSWQASARMELGLRLENLTDENYREHGSGLDAAGRNVGFWLNALF